MKIDTAVLKDQAKANPLLTIGIAVGAVNSLSKLIDTVTRSKNARTWKKEVARRSKK